MIQTAEHSDPLKEKKIKSFSYSSFDFQASVAHNETRVGLKPWFSENDVKVSPPINKAEATGRYCSVVK